MPYMGEGKDKRRKVNIYSYMTRAINTYATTMRKALLSGLCDCLVLWLAVLHVRKSLSWLTSEGLDIVLSPLSLLFIIIFSPSKPSNLSLYCSLYQITSHSFQQQNQCFRVSKRFINSDNNNFTTLWLTFFSSSYICSERHQI